MERCTLQAVTQMAALVFAAVPPAGQKCNCALVTEKEGKVMEG
jgi:hypothetical protein